MTSDVRIYDYIKTGDNGEIEINLIYKTDNSISKVKEYKYKYNRDSNLNDLSKSVTDEKIFQTKYSNTVIACKYDEDTTAQIIVNHARHNRGMIDWNINVREYPIAKYKNCLNSYYPNKSLTVWCEERIGGIGSTGASVSLIIKILILIYKRIIPICVNAYFFIHRVDRAYKKLEEVTGYDKNFIKLVITKSHTWDRNFITNYYFSEKAKLEKIVMKDLKYKYNKKTKIYSNYNNLGC